MTLTATVFNCHVLFRARLSEVRVESLFGPRPGTTVGEGSYNMLIRLIHNREQLTMCKYRYHVTGEATFLLKLKESLVICLQALGYFISKVRVVSQWMTTFLFPAGA
jgi:hypothetical protein